MGDLSGRYDRDMHEVTSNRARCIALLVMAGLAILGLLVSFGWLPVPIAVCVATIPLILFPGVFLTFVFPRDPTSTHPAEQLALWFVTGISILAFLGFVGILTRTTLHTLMFVTALVYAAIALVGVLVLRYSRPSVPGQTGKVVPAILLAAAIALALSTLGTARSHDDWFYLAYMRDYSDEMPMNSEDAIFDKGASASPRAWYGAWWVAEAMLSRAAGADPVQYHQIFLPVLVFPFSVFALFTLAKHIFRSEKPAYLACFIQVVCYLSSASPSDSAGWALLCKTAQDKTVCCLILVPVAVVLALKLNDRLREVKMRQVAGTYVLYVVALVGSALIHPMGAIWAGIGTVPFLTVEALRQRTGRAAMVFVVILIPFLLSAAILHQGRVATVSTLEEREAERTVGKGRPSFLEPYFPGRAGRFPSGDRVYAVSERISVAHPALITRYPLALLGLALTFVIVRHFRDNYTVRYLTVITFSTLLLGFVPGVAGVTSALITERMLYRLAWLFPWGLTVAFVLLLAAKRLRWAWLIAISIALILCRGNPSNYLRAATAVKAFGRPTPELVEVLGALSAEPSPQGVVVASAGTSMMIPGLVGGAYPVRFRSDGQMGGTELTDLFQRSRFDQEVKDVLLWLDAKYILAEKRQPIARALESAGPGLRPVFSNRGYGLWEVRLAAGW